MLTSSLVETPSSVSGRLARPGPAEAGSCVVAAAARLASRASPGPESADGVASPPAINTPASSPHLAHSLIAMRPPVPKLAAGPASTRPGPGPLQFAGEEQRQFRL